MVSPQQIVNFAYGSNMLIRRIRERAPSAKPIGMGQLPRHVLRWHKRGCDGSGKCDALFTGDDSDVGWGVLYELSAADKLLLDKVEGLHCGYEEKQVAIATGDDTFTVQLYIATTIDSALNPFDWYKEFVVTGAREHNLPPSYIRMLRMKPEGRYSSAILY